MRKIKFRFWHEIDRKMYYFSLGDLLFATDNHKKDIGLWRVLGELELTSKNPSEDERIMQYTGEKDDNGTEIYK